MTDDIDGGEITSLLHEDLTALLDRLRSADDVDVETIYFVLMSLIESLIFVEEGSRGPSLILSARKEQP